MAGDDRHKSTSAGHHSAEDRPIGRFVSWLVAALLLVAPAPETVQASKTGVDDSPRTTLSRAVPAPPGQRRLRRRRRRRPQIPEGRAIGDLDRAGCEAILRSRNVAFARVDDGEAPGVAQPIRLEGPIAGVTLRHRSEGRGSRRRRRRIRRLSILDCRVAVAILAWSATLRGAGVRSLEHYSVYRPGAQVAGSGRPSGHASGLAVDLGVLVLDDDRRVVVEEAWRDRRRSVAPCPAREGDDDDQRLLRDLVCAAADADLFQVVLTPHHDEAHENHVHLELRPGVSWSLLE